MRTRHHGCGLLMRGFLVVLICAFTGSAGCSSEEGLKVKRLSKERGEAGDFVRIHGSGFQSVTRDVRVFFGNNKAKVQRFNNDTEIVVVVPGGVETGKTVDVEIVFEPGGSKNLPNAFTYATAAQSTVDDLVGGGKSKPKK